MVAEMRLEPGGLLEPVPGAPWRTEAARGEAGVERRLAALADAPTAKIVAFASDHGPLGLGVTSATQVPDSVIAVAAVAYGQNMVDAVGAARVWLEEGADPPFPGIALDALTLGSALRRTPDNIRAAFGALMDGQHESVALAAAAQGRFDPARFLSEVLPNVTIHPRQGPLRTDERDALSAGLDYLEWLGGIIGGIDDVPAPLAEMGGSPGLIRQAEMLPAGFIRSAPGASSGHLQAFEVSMIMSEPMDAWRQFALFARGCLAAASLANRAIFGSLLSTPQRDQLASLCVTLFGIVPPDRLAASDLANRVRAIGLAWLERELEARCAWPVRRGSMHGLYVRATIGLRSHFADEGLVMACETTGCTGRFRLTRNRRYCDRCRDARRAADVRRVRERDGRRVGLVRERAPLRNRRTALAAS